MAFLEEPESTDDPKYWEIDDPSNLENWGEFSPEGED